MLLLTNIFLIIGGTCRFFRVKQSARLLLCNNSAVTNGTEVDWIDIHKFLHIIDRLEVLVGRSMVEGHVGYVCHCCTHWTGPTVSRNLWYELFSVIYVVHNYCLYTVLQLWSSWNRNCRVLLFLYRCLTMVGSDMRLVTTWCICRPTQFPLEVKRYLFMGGLK